MEQSMKQFTACLWCRHGRVANLQICRFVLVWVDVAISGNRYGTNWVRGYGSDKATPELKNSTKSSSNTALEDTVAANNNREVD
jgi:hypothetical protein